MDNYRPISILTTLSKVYERILNSRLVKYLEHNNLLADSQYGFRNGRSTDDAVHELTQTVVRALDRREKCLTVFLDLSKAFDTVSVPRLIQKLETFGVRGVPLALFQSYLSDRYQRVKIGDSVSNELPINIGVPQGSILGPTLFLCYINEICQINLKQCNITAYADDTALTFYARSWDELSNVAQSGLTHVCHLLSKNFLTLNDKKTKYIVYSIINTDNMPLSIPLVVHKCNFNLNIPCNCPIIESTDNIKYLGVIIDKNLNFKVHIHMISQKIRKLAYLFKNLRHIADEPIIKMVYLSLAQSVLTYCIRTWGGAHKSTMIELERAQRMLLKVIYFKPRVYPTFQLYAEAKVLSIRQLYIMATVLHQHSQVNNINIKRDVRRYYTVCEQKSVKTNFAQRFFYFQATRLYNMLNKKLNIIDLTRKNLKNILFSYLNNLDYLKTESYIEIEK